MRGGTDSIDRARVQPKGLSPLARGNQQMIACVKASEGSIPACAGEPDDDLLAPEYVGVYPRLRGGTWVSIKTRVSGQGLSPLARGNR